MFPAMTSAANDLPAFSIPGSEWCPFTVHTPKPDLYAFHTLPAFVGIPFIALRVSTMQFAHLPSST